MSVIYFPSCSPPVTVNGVGNYTLKYYSVDKFNNIESIQTKTFSIVQTPLVKTGKIRGYLTKLSE